MDGRRGDHKRGLIAAQSRSESQSPVSRDTLRAAKRCETASERAADRARLLAQFLTELPNRVKRLIAIYPDDSYWDDDPEIEDVFSDFVASAIDIAWDMAREDQHDLAMPNTITLSA